MTLTDQRTGPNRVAPSWRREIGGGGIGPERSAFLVARWKEEEGSKGRKSNLLHGSLAPTRLLQRARARGQGRTASDAFFAVVIIAYSIDFLPAGGARSSASKAASSPIFGMPRNLEARGRVKSINQRRGRRSKQIMIRTPFCAFSPPISRGSG